LEIKLENKIPLFKIYWDESEIELTNKVIRRGSYWTIGTETPIFEDMISKYIGINYCVVFNSGTSALHAVLKANNIGPGDEVIVPSFTFIATANAPLFVGAKPVFADIEEQTYGLDPDDVLKRINRKTKAILPIHFGGLPCRVKELKAIADDHKVLLIEDAAEAFGASISSKKVGTFGHSSIFSFCQNKIVSTGEGGAVVTEDKEIFEKLKLIRSHGRPDKKDYFTSSEHIDYVTLGYNFRLSEISAALGIAQLKKVDKIIQMRRENAAYLSKKLAPIEQLFVLETPKGYSHVYQMFNVKVMKGGDTREKLMSFLNSKGVSTKVNFYPVHLTKFYRDKFGYKPGELPVTEQVSTQMMTLPMYPALTKLEIDYVTDQLKDFFSKD
jgi:perosamine synthetase